MINLSPPQGQPRGRFVLSVLAFAENMLPFMTDLVKVFCLELETKHMLHFMADLVKISLSRARDKKQVA